MKVIFNTKHGRNESSHLSRTSADLLKSLWRGFMFSAEEIIEIIVILSVTTKKINKVYQSPYQFLLTGYNQPYLSGEDQLNISTYRSLLSYEQLVSIISKYYPDDKPSRVWTHPINKKLLGTDETLTVSKLWHNDEEIGKLAIPLQRNILYFIREYSFLCEMERKQKKTTSVISRES